MVRIKELTVDVLGCHCGRPPGPVIDMGGIGPPGPSVLLGGGPRNPGPYDPGPKGPIEGPRGGFILGFIGFIPGGPVANKDQYLFDARAQNVIMRGTERHQHASTIFL